MRISVLLKLGPALLLLLVTHLELASGTEGMSRYWVYLQPKAVDDERLLQTEQDFTEKNRQRRQKNGIQRADVYDLPVSSEAVASIRDAGVRVRQVSRWLNAVSVEATAEQMERIRENRFVNRVEPFRLRCEVIELRESRADSPLDDPVYGPSLTQNELCRVPELHSRGLSGQGVLIGFLDTGWNRNHNAFAQMNVLATYDFIWHDTVVSNERGEDSLNQDLHGTATLSVCGGYADSTLIGPAYGATFAVAKTEWVWGEERSEEDNYVAAIEWADSLGADITSSSLGYTDWYEYDDLDGHTAVTTQAAAIAQRRGILVVTSAGNNRNLDWFYVSTPADADSILAVGAVDSAGSLAVFSSGGPTADGRVKPDVSAMGFGVYCAHREDPDLYFRISGTSLSAPIISGIAALVMEAHPDWTAQDVRNAMMATASRASQPDNELGWGIVDGVGAVDYELNSKDQTGPRLPRSISLLEVFPQPVNGEVTVRFQIDRAGAVTLRVYDLLGRLVKEFESREAVVGENLWRFDVAELSSGTYHVALSTAAGKVSGKLVVVK